MQRSTVSLTTRQAQALLRGDDDDDDGAKNKSPALSFSMQVLLRSKATLAAILLGAIFLRYYLNSGLNSQALNNQVTVVQSENKGLLNDQVVALQSENNELLRDQVKALQSENKGLRLRLESGLQSNVRRREEKLAAVAAAVTPIRRSIPFEAPVVPTKVLAAVATPVAAINKVAAVSPLEPIACQDFIDQAKGGDGTYLGRRVTDPNIKSGRFTRKTTTEHPFWISLHNKEFDKTRWTIFEDGQYYERVLGKIWTNILREASPGSRVLDVGGNIGYYSLVSASMGEFHIDSFEPNLKNALRFCESLVMNSWKNEQEQASGDMDPDSLGRPSVNIWPAGVSDTTGTLRFFESYGNPGAGRFTNNFGNDRTDYTELPVTTLDAFAEERGWFESRPEIAIMKVDVERQEAKVLVGAEKLLKSGIVQNIFTETSMEDPERRQIEVAALELLVEAGYKLKGQGGWPGPGKDNPWPNDENLVKNIFDYIATENKEYLNLWWSL